MTHLQTTPVSVTNCPRCRAVILTGTAEGLRARVDPTALTRAGLIAAILTNRPTYRLTRTGLVHLDQERIRATNIHGPIVTTHKCGQPMPAQYHDTTITEIVTITDPERIPY